MNTITPIESAALEKAVRNAWASGNMFESCATEGLFGLPFATLKMRPLPSWKTMEQTLRQWHEDSLDDPEYLWLAPNFEDMADTVNKAMFCAGAIVDETPDDSWMARQEPV